MFTKLVSISFLFAVLSCANQNGFINFDIESTGGHRLTVQIPLDSFLSEVLNGYSDPGLRKTLETCGDPNTTAPFEYFKTLTNTAKTNDYDIVKYFSLGNPVLFSKDNDIDQLQSTLEDEYVKSIDAAIEMIHTQLDAQKLRHNIYRSESGQMIIEVSIPEDLDFVKSTIQQKVNECLVISETLLLMDVLAELVLLDSIHAANKSDIKKAWFLFGDKLEIPTTFESADMYGTSELRIKSNDPVLGRVEDSDTAFIAEILRNQDSLFPENTQFAWLEEKGQDNKAERYFLLYCLSVQTNSMNGNDIDSVNVIEYEEFEQVSVRLIFNEIGSERWSDLTSKNISKVLTIAIGSEILCAPIVQMRIDGGICEISGDYDYERANQLANRIRSSIFPFSFYTVSEEVIQAK